MRIQDAACFSFILLNISMQVCGEPGVLDVWEQYAFVGDEHFPVTAILDRPHFSHCVTYNPLFSSLPSGLVTPSKSQLKKIVNLTPWHGCCRAKDSGKDWLNCDVGKPLHELNGAIVIVARGNCSFSEKARTLQHFGASAALIQLDEPTDQSNFVPSAALVSDYSEINISVGTISKPKDVIEAWGYLHEFYNGDELEKALWTLGSMLCLAVFSVCVGSHWSGKARFDSLYSQSSVKSVREEAADILSSGMEGQELCTIVFIVAINTTFLMLLYLFYDIAVYVMIGLFCLGSANSLHHCLSTFLDSFGLSCQSRLPPNNLPYLKSRPQVASVALGIFAVGIATTWFIYRNHYESWILQDIMALAFCISCLYHIRFPNLKYITVLLTLLFVYDVFFVFVTPYFTKTGRSVMESAATGSESKTHEKLPILFKVPNANYDEDAVCKGVTNEFSMLGFGDVLVPGFLVSYVRFVDLTIPHQRLPVYFIVASLGYVLGLLLTFVGLLMMATAQPALFYIVPSLLTTVLMTAAHRGHFHLIWHGHLEVRGKDYQHVPVEAPDDVTIDPVEPGDTDSDHDDPCVLTSAASQAGDARLLTRSPGGATVSSSQGSKFKHI